MARKGLRVWAGAALALCAGGLVAGSFLAWGPRLPFDSQTWRELEDPAGPLGSMMPGGDNRRARMVDDLLGDHLRPGASWSPLRRLLGRTSAAGEGMYCYDLLWRPSPGQEVVALLRWGTNRPTLIVEVMEDGRGGTVRRFSVR